MWIQVLLRHEGKGSVSLLCEEILPDPFFASKVVLKNIQGLTWPVSGQWMQVQQWSVEKSAILSWMVGPVEDQLSITRDMLVNGGSVVPWPVGSLPNATFGLEFKPEEESNPGGSLASDLGQESSPEETQMLPDTSEFFDPYWDLLDREEW